MTTGHRKILLVDDNPRVRSFVKPALEDAGFECIEAEDGWFALEKMEGGHPDLIVLDIMLGDDAMNGLDDLPPIVIPLLNRCRSQNSFRCRWTITKRAVWSDLIVLLAPSFNQYLGLG